MTKMMCARHAATVGRGVRLWLPVMTIALGLGAAPPSASADEPWIIDFPEGFGAVCLSADGQVVGGNFDVDGTARPALWSADAGVTVIGDPAHSEYFVDLTSDGSTALVARWSPWEPEPWAEALLYHAGGAVELLEDGYDWIQQLSMDDDGRTVSGLAFDPPPPAPPLPNLAWTAGTGWDQLPLPPDTNWAEVKATCGDGTAIAGIGRVAGSNNLPFLWTRADPGWSVAVLDPGGGMFGMRSISGDGRVLTWELSEPDGVGGYLLLPWRWEDGVGTAVPIPTDSAGLVVSRSGQVMVGGGWNTGSSATPKALIWDEVHGTRYLHLVLLDQGLDLSGRALAFVVDIAADDRTMLCTDRAPDPDRAVLVHLAAETVPGDATGDGVVNVDDLLAVLGAWGPCADCPEDLDGDGVVGVADLLEVLGHWTG